MATSWMDSGHNEIMLDCMGAIRNEVVNPVSVSVKFYDWDSPEGHWRHFLAEITYDQREAAWKHGTDRWHILIEETPRKPLSNPSPWNQYTSAFATFKDALDYFSGRIRQAKSAKIQKVEIQ